MKEKPGNRYFVVFIIIILFSMVILYNLYQLQIVEGEEYYDKSQNSIYRKTKSVAPRGRIYDRNETPIAYNEHGYAVELVKTDIDTNTLNKCIFNITEVLERNGDEYCNRIKTYLCINPLRFNVGTDQVVKWQKEFFKLSDDNVKKTPRELFDYLRDFFQIQDAYTDTEAYNIMRVRYEILLNEWSYINYNPVVISSDISRNSVAELEERHHEMPGVNTKIIPKRKYSNAQYAPHVLGYVGPITRELYEKWKDDGYGNSDIVGITGIELAAESYLRGREGHSEIEVDTMGRLKRILDEESAVSGKDIVLTIDMELQKVALESLEKYINIIREDKEDKRNHGDANAGAVVAIDVNSGEVLAMVSYPGYDPSIFLDSNNNEAEITRLFTDEENKPLYNRALQFRYAPGSTFKPLVAIAALEEGVITPDRVVMDDGHEVIGGKDFYCLEYVMGLGAHGALRLQRALAASCNMYFHIVGVETSIEKIDKWAKYFGLGEKTGIELYEEKGIRANREYKKAAYGDEWWIADTAQASIGQLYNDFTPIQLVNYVASIANGGKRYRPHLIKRILNPDGTVFKEIEPEYEQIPVKIETLEAVREGMRSVAHSVDGTAERIFGDFPIAVAGKTGTAEIGTEQEGGQSSNGLFVCYAPVENPEIAVAVVVEHGVWGSNVAPIARDVLAAYFGIELQQETETEED